MTNKSAYSTFDINDLAIKVSHANVTLTLFFHLCVHKVTNKIFMCVPNFSYVPVLLENLRIHHGRLDIDIVDVLYNSHSDFFSLGLSETFEELIGDELFLLQQKLDREIEHESKSSAELFI